MPNTKDASSIAVQVARWLGRAIATLFIAFWLFIIAAGAVTDSGDPWTWESTGVVVLFVVSAISVAIAWPRQGIGSLLVLSCGVAYGAFAYLSAGHNKGLAVATAGGPLMVSGTLLLTSWWRMRGQRRNAQPPPS